MSLFTIDTNRCDNDGICAIECPAHIIEMTESGPVPAANAQEVCIQCGHCVAICPKGAFRLEFLSPDQCMPIQKELMLTEDHTEHFLRSRRSIRRYKEKAIPRNLFEKALSMACCAPTGSNRQTVKWLVIDKRSDVQKIAGHVIDWMRYVVQNHPEIAQMLNMESLIDQWDTGIDRICRNAPQLVFAYASDEYGSGTADCHTALAYLELALPSLGLGSCWAGYVNYAAGQWPPLAKMLNFPEKHSCHGAVMAAFQDSNVAVQPTKNSRISYIMFDNLSIRAGSRAIEIIQDEGLDPARIKVLAGASGSAKFLVLTGIDRVLVSLFKERTDPLYLLGTSIGAFRMVAFCQKDPLEAINRLEQEYISQQYSLHPTRQDVTRETKRILDAYIKNEQIHDMLQHPVMKLNFLSNKCKGLLKQEQMILQWAGLTLAAGVNLMSRRKLALFLERALFTSPKSSPPFASMDQFPINRYDLTPANFKSALLSSGSIPVAMEGVCDIDGAPGVFRDGGILDYHLDIPFLPGSDNLVLYPHFYETITPGWFDKGLHRKPCAKNMENVVLVAPSEKFVKSLPLGKIPDRKDFMTFKGKDAERRGHWKKAIEKNKILGDEFFEAVQSKKIKEIVTPL